ncbi:unnamed protein product [Parascedosporium putredinis]|uniref:Uncharacterized protein n=1 Tax=Parascedosporium putredinis TaxID=1442378 RepID=A0A9P1GVN1_9PEZI|nr:unnamed protein product [Parascedosporium putredinis]CAI7987869.1 unnamed protein product [Parascedosporium putredinis]
MERLWRNVYRNQNASWFTEIPLPTAYVPRSSIPSPKCLQLKRGFAECRRGLVDMRKRFRGNVPVSYQAIQKADEEGKGYQLYAGKTAFGGGVKYTNGDEQEQDWRELANEKYRAELAAKKDGPPKA